MANNTEDVELQKLYKEVEYMVTMEYLAPNAEPAKSRIDRVMRMFTSYTKQRELALLERLENQSIPIADGLLRVPKGYRQVVPLSAIFKEKEKTSDE